MLTTQRWTRAWLRFCATKRRCRPKVRGVRVVCGGVTLAEKVMSALTMQEHELLAAIRRINDKISQQTDKLVTATTPQPPAAPHIAPRATGSASALPRPPAAPHAQHHGPASPQPQPQPQPQSRRTTGGDRPARPVPQGKVATAADAMQAMMLANRPRAPHEHSEPRPVAAPPKSSSSYLQTYLQKHERK